MPVEAADEETLVAAQVLSRQLFVRAAELSHQWSEQVEPELDPAWREVAGVSNTRVVVSASEAEAITDAIEATLAPYVLREDSDWPDGARSVRLIRYVLPEADEENSAR